MKDALGTTLTVNDRVALLGDPVETYVGRVSIVDLVNNSVVIECDQSIDPLGNVSVEKMTVQAEPRWVLVLK